MSRRTYLVAGIVLALVVGLGIGLPMAVGQSGPDLPDLTAAQLLAQVAEQAGQTPALNGDFSWTNDLLGGADLPLPRGEGLGAFLGSGSGRLWLQEDGARLESQSARGDTLAVTNGDTLWIYSSREATVSEYALPPHDDPDKTKRDAPLDLPARIQAMVEKLAPTAALSVTEARVAERDAYVLILAPTAENTVFGSAQVAFDSEHFLPLSLQVFSKSGDTPVLAAGFDRVSFEPAEASLFTFTPPPGASVEKKELKLPEGMFDPPMGMPHFGKEYDRGDADKEPLSLEEAQAMAGFTLATPENPPLAFSGVRVIPAHEAGSPVVVLTYGEGFGTVLVVQTKVDADMLERMTQGMQPGDRRSGGAEGMDEPDDGSGAPRGGSVDAAGVLGALLQPVSVNGQPAFQIDTRLGSAIAWQQGDIGVLVAGSVSPGDLSSFAADVR